MKGKFTVVFVFATILLSCSQKTVPEQFDEIERETPTKEFFIKNVVEKDKDVFEIENRSYTALEMFEKYKQTQDVVQNEMKNNENEIIGQLYAIERYNDNDTIFKFENLKFYSFNIYSDNENNTVAFKLYGGGQKLDDLFKFIKKYNPKDKNSVAETFELQDYYNLNLKNKKVFLIVTNNMNALPSPMSINDSEQITSNKSNKVNEKFSPSIELVVIFNNLGFELEEYILKDNNYFR